MAGKGRLSFWNSCLDFKLTHAYKYQLNGNRGHRITALTRSLTSSKVAADITLAGRHFRDRQLIENTMLAGIVVGVLLLLRAWLLSISMQVSQRDY